MSQRHVTVKDLGDTDCQGWLQRRKDGRSFLGSKWKRYWFVLKKSCLYWYCDKTAQKAEGFINLSGFSIEQTKACRKKHVITASHPHVVTIFIAADSFMDMNKYVSDPSALQNRSPLPQSAHRMLLSAERYSEDSDQDTDESGSTSCAMDSEVDPTEPEAVSKPVLRPAAETKQRLSSEGNSSSLSSRQRMSDLCPAPLSQPTDEMESLYRRLKAARLSPVGQKDFRASFIRRSPNEQVNEKLHLLRILSSTLKVSPPGHLVSGRAAAGFLPSEPTDPGTSDRTDPERFRNAEFSFSSVNLLNTITENCLHFSEICLIFGSLTKYPNYKIY
uniref:Connector enhancer of kinase suppressor of ras 2-like n=1 Tax=Fundulus heteroclitus TaxID=8078 RepID=A0A3Q2PF80_FUNHE